MKLNNFSGNALKYDLSVHPDYNNELFEGSLVFNGTPQGLQSGDRMFFVVLDKKGNIVSDNGTFEVSDINLGMGLGYPYISTYFSTYKTTADMGVQGQSYNPSVSASYITDDLYYLQTSVRNATKVGGSPYTTQLDMYPRLPQGTGYPNVPITISRGDHVIYGQVSTVENKTKVTLNLDPVSKAALSGNGAGYVNGLFLKRSIVDVERPQDGLFNVISQDLNNDIIYLDGDATSLSGAWVKIKPRPTLASYSGWTDPQYISSRLTFQTPLATGQGRFLSRVNAVTSYDSYDIGPIFLNGNPGVFSIDRMLVEVAGDSFNRQIAVGDYFTYESSITPGTYITSLVISRSSTNLNLSGDVALWTIGLVSGDAPIVDATGTLIPFSDYRVENYPQFGEDVTAILFGTASGDTALQSFVSQQVRMPSADFEMVANDYDSSFGTITETAHFHVGGVSLSNGQTLKSDSLKLSAKLYSTDPTDSNPISSWTVYGTQGPDAAEQYSGNYVRNGAYALVYSNVFDSAQVLHLSGTFSIGSASVEKNFNIPVQPNS